MTMLRTGMLVGYAALNILLALYAIVFGSDSFWAPYSLALAHVTLAFAMFLRRGWF